MKIQPYFITLKNQTKYRKLKEKNIKIVTPAPDEVRDLFPIKKLINLHIVFEVSKSNIIIESAKNNNDHKLLEKLLVLCEKIPLEEKKNSKKKII